MVMRLVWHLCVLVVFAAAAGARAAEQAIVSVLYSNRAGPYLEAVEGFRQHLFANDVPLLLYEHTTREVTPSVLKEHLGEKTPGVVLAMGSRSLKFARSHVHDVSVVFCMVFADTQLARGGVAGVTLNIPTVAKLNGLKRIMPAVQRVGVVFSPRSLAAMPEVARACSSTALTMVERRVNSQRDFPRALSDMTSDMDCFLMVADPTVYIPSSVDYLLRRGLSEGFPVIGLSSQYTKAGALLSFDCDYAGLGRQAAALTLRILDGTPVDSVGVVPPAKTTYSVNVSVANRLGVRVPEEVLQGAGQVFGR